MATTNVPRVTHWPADWFPLIDKVRGEMDFAEFVRDCVRQQLAVARPAEARKLSPNPTRRKDKAAT